MHKSILAAVTGALITGAGMHTAASAAECPNDGVVRFGVEPYESAALLLPVYRQMGQVLGKKLGCEVKIQITTNYNAEIEAMRSDKLEIAQFGPLGYVMAHKLAGAEAVATFAGESGEPDTYYASIVTWRGSGLKRLQDVRGRSFAYSDPASTSGHLFPSFGLKKNGIDPENGVRAMYAGTHTQSYEVLRQHKVDAGELNSEQIAAAKRAGIYERNDYVTLWKSAPIPTDPITVRDDLPEAFKDRVADALLSLDFNDFSGNAREVLIGNGDHLVATSSAAYDQIRDVVDTMGLTIGDL